MPWIRFTKDFVHYPTKQSTQYFQTGQEMCATRALAESAIAAGAAQAIEKPKGEAEPAAEAIPPKE